VQGCEASADGVALDAERASVSFRASVERPRNMRLYGWPPYSIVLSRPPIGRISSGSATASTIELGGTGLVLMSLRAQQVSYARGARGAWRAAASTTAPSSASD